ncbi:MAG: DMT family transporter [Gammaproteobacteria bacterium]|nr:DMT family transporter [Gammaproteobacteria bacterium]
MKNSFSPPVFMLLWAATFWGVVWYPLRLLEAEGLSGLWTTWVIFFAAAIPGLWLAWSSRCQLLQQPGLLLLLAAANGWLNTAFVLAVLDGNIVRVLLLFYLSPLWSTLLAWLWLKERPSPLAMATLGVAMAGALFMLWHPALGFPWPQGRADWLAISAGIGFSFSNVAVRRLKHLSAPLKAAVVWWGVVVVAGLALLVSGAPLPQVSITVWTGALLLGVVGIFSATLAVVYGVTHMPVHRSAVILLFELVAGAVSSQWLTDEVVTRMEWFGGGLILLAAYLSARRRGRTVATKKANRSGVVCRCFTVAEMMLGY